MRKSKILKQCIKRVIVILRADVVVGVSRSGQIQADAATAAAAAALGAEGAAGPLPEVDSAPQGAEQPAHQGWTEFHDDHQ